jgi:GNAT superfamily N-acetyltransferase
MPGRAQSRRRRLTIRPATETDFEQWLPLWKGYNAFYGRVGKTALAKEITLTTWRRFFDPHEPVHALVAERGDDLIGLAHYLFHRNTLMQRGTCYLQDLFTSEAARGKGVGRRMIQAVYEQAKNAGATRVYWHTHETNAVAMGLYDKVAVRTGFVVYRQDL